MGDAGGWRLEAGPWRLPRGSRSPPTGGSQAAQSGPCISLIALSGHGPLPLLSPLRSPQSRPRATAAEPSTSAAAAEPAKYAGVQPRSVATWELAKAVMPSTSAAAVEPAKYAGVQPRSVATWELAKAVHCRARDVGRHRPLRSQRSWPLLRCFTVSLFHRFTCALATLISHASPFLPSSPSSSKGGCRRGCRCKFLHCDTDADGNIIRRWPTLVEKGWTVAFLSEEQMETTEEKKNK